MAYIRKGGKGLDPSKSLKTQFNYYKKQLFNRLLQEQAMQEAISGFSFSGTIYTTFENLDFDKISKEGITRKVGTKTVRFTGEEAVKIQIESMKKRASKTYQTNQFIENYCTSLKKIGLPMNEVEEIRKAMMSTSSNNLTYIIEQGILPSIAYVYSDELDYKDLYDSIMFALTSKLTKQQKYDIRTARENLKPLITERMKREGWL